MRALLALLPLVVAGCSSDTAPVGRGVPEVTVVTITPRDIPSIGTFVAQTESSRQVDIVARVSGFLDDIAYQEGEVVKEGQVLFRLDRKPFEAQLEAARGELQAQQARFKTAQANLERVKPLAQQDALAQADLDRAQGDHDAAEAAVYSASATVKEAELNLGYATIFSPVAGLSSRALQREGAYVNSTSDTARLTYVAAIDPIWVTFSMSQNLETKYRDQIEEKILIPPENDAYDVEIVMPDGTVYPHTGRISFADPSFSQETGSFQIRAVLPNPEHHLRPGMFVTANVKGGIRPNAIVVPQLAVQQGSNGHVVYVVNKDGIAEVRPVVVGDYHGDAEVVVMSGLHGGDRVVVDGVLRVVPGQPVKVVDPGAPAMAGKETAASQPAAIK